MQTYLELAEAYKDFSGLGGEYGTLARQQSQSNIFAAQDRIKANHVKTEIKRLFSAIDVEHSGFVKITVF